MRGAIYYLSLVTVLIGAGCNAQGIDQWKEIRQHFKPMVNTHFYGHDTYDPQPNNPQLEELPIVPLIVRERIAHPSIDTARACFRFPIGSGRWQALIFLVGPGEASSHLNYHLIAWDSVAGLAGKELILTENFGEGDVNAMESWIEDIDNDGVYEIIKRHLEYPIPSVYVENDVVVYPPEWSTKILHFSDGNFVEGKVFTIDSLQYTMEEEKQMRAAFIEAGFQKLLPPRLR